jgi:hypothetical protein
MKSNTMVYTTKEHGDGGYTILTQDGGTAFVHESDNLIHLTLCQNRFAQDDDEGKQYIKDFPLGTDRKSIVKYALDWLVVSTNAQIQFHYVK